jgi:hypothetical protein
MVSFSKPLTANAISMDDEHASGVSVLLLFALLLLLAKSL